MQMSQGEKLIAFMLADLMEKLQVESEIDPAVIKRFMASNDEWALEHIYSGILDGDPRPEDEVKETADILMMFRVLDGKVANLTDEERSQVDVDRLKFQGFDGNEHGGHLRIARVMVEDIGWYDERQPITNCHHSIVSRYRRMLAKFNEAVEGSSLGTITIEELQEIASA